jgi:hypothetical protein
MYIHSIPEEMSILRDRDFKNFHKEGIKKYVQMLRAVLMSIDIALVSCHVKNQNSLIHSRRTNLPYMCCFYLRWLPMLDQSSSPAYNMITYCNGSLT